MKRLIGIVLAALLSFAAQRAYAQGCDALLRDGAFETLNQFGSTFRTDEWHNAWCNGTLVQTTQNSSHQAKLNLVVFEIPLGFSYDDAKSFQQFYQTSYCGTADRSTVDMSQVGILRKTVSPDLVSAYVDCHKTELSGLRTTFKAMSDNKTFVMTMRYVGDGHDHDKAVLDTISFRPSSNKPPKCDGTLKAKTKIGLDTVSMSCERFTDGPITVFVGTNVGAFYRQLAPIVPPPTDTERVMKALPAGTILPWSGKGTVPSGWHLCDGTAGTPNLVNQYLIGTDDLASVGKATGEPSHTHRVVGGTGYPGDGGFAGEPENRGRNALFCCTEGHNGYRIHGHGFDVTPPPVSNRPPSVYVRYIIKL
jgi:hypothetical protein